ncbi:procyclic form-specific polypeptide B1-alpha-like [Bubalus kerabau]|uniref:procyclic form-specific polypeptide B1-alpha-like n=1 Tax=Bubalus carabanensis TaxID=3119969 RepID=UPI00244EE5F0|nr:procyclic form-specific polypeptide B1-alpha-like [Bubalus carabanensis]
MMFTVVLRESLYVCASAPACLYVTLYTCLSVCSHTSGWRAGLPASLGLLAVRPACRCVGVGLAAPESRRRTAGAGGRGVGGCAGPAEGRAGLRQGRAGTGKLLPPPPRPGIAGPWSARPGPAPPRPCTPSRPWRKGAPPATPEPERSGIRAGTRTLAGAEPEREPELEPKLEPAVRRTERSEAAKPIPQAPAFEQAPPDSPQTS